VASAFLVLSSFAAEGKVVAAFMAFLEEWGILVPLWAVTGSSYEAEAFSVVCPASVWVLGSFVSVCTGLIC